MSRGEGPECVKVEGFEVFAAAEIMPRAKGLMRLLVKELKKREYKLTTYDENWREGLRFDIKESYCSFWIEEKTTASERMDSVGKPVRVGTGKLILKMEANTSSDSRMDGKREPLEEKLGYIIASIEMMAERFQRSAQEMRAAEVRKRQEVLERIKRETDIEYVARMWPELPFGVKAGIVMMVRTMIQDGQQH